jgi:hypothetical protein
MANNRLIAAQAIHLGDAGLSLNVSTLDEPGNLGAFIEKNGTMYQLVQVVSGPVKHGDTLCWNDPTTFKVRPSSSALANYAAGIANASILSGNFGFMAVAGKFTSIACGATPPGVDGALLAFVQSLNGVVSLSAVLSAPVRPVGTALGASYSATGLESTSIVVDALLDFPFNF